jgi:hypothetical protein
MKPRPLIDIAILAAGIVLAAVIYASGGEAKQAPAVAAAPAPVVIRTPDAAPRITQPPLVAVPALPARPRRAKRPAARKPAAPARRAHKPKRRSQLKPAPLEPPLQAPPE